MSDKVETLPAGIPMPPEIAVAVLDVMSKVKALEKEAQTTGGSRFKYTSVDQFFELLGPLMAAAGIFTILHETNAVVEQRTSANDTGGSRTSSWMTTDYEIWIYHKSGVGYGPIKRKIQVVASGPQSYGMGPSYLEKYFLRSLFKVPTGDEDADDHPKTGLPATRDERAKEEDRAEADKAVRDYITKCKAAWSKALSQEEMGKWWRETKEERAARFTGNDDPLYKEFKAGFEEAGKKLPEKATGSTTVTSGKTAEEKPKDDVPEFNGDGRPSESSIRMNFKTALIRCVGRDDCNEAFIKYVEPFEKGLPKPFVDEMYKLLQERIELVEK